MEGAIRTIGHAYQKLNIYTSILLYDEITQRYIDEMYDELQNQDFPVYMIHRIEDLELPCTELERNYRMFVMPAALYNEYLIKKQYDLETVSVIFLWGCDVVSEGLQSKLLNLQKNLHVIKI